MSPKGHWAMSGGIGRSHFPGVLLDSQILMTVVGILRRGWARMWTGAQALTLLPAWLLSLCRVHPPRPLRVWLKRSNQVAQVAVGSSKLRKKICQDLM